MTVRSLVIFIGISLFVCACGLQLTEEERLATAQRMIDNHKYQEAMEFLKPLSGTENQEFVYLVALSALGLNNSDDAARLLLPIAESNDVRAYVPLAKAYRRLDRFEEAAVWLQKSADTGNADSLFQLARFYWEGLGVTSNRLRTYELLAIAEQHEETSDKARGWREHYDFRVEMETWPETLPHGACLVYVDKPYLLDHGRDRFSTAWCDESIEESIRTMALEEVHLYLDREFGSSYGYQAKATFVKHNVGYTIDGLYNRWRGSDIVKFIYSPGAHSTYSSSCRPLETDCP